MTVLDDVLTEIKAVLRSVEGLRNLPDEPPAQLNAFPAAIVYPTRGAARWATAYGENGVPMAWKSHTVTIDLYVIAGAFSDATAKKLRPFAYSVPNALMHAYATDRIGGLVTTLGDPQGGGQLSFVRYEGINSATPGGTPAYGWRFEIDISYTEDVTA